MPEVKVKDVISFSSEDRKHPAANLLKREGTSKWKCTEGEKQATVTLQLEKATEIQQIDIGNEGSAFIEVLVARDSDEFKVILGASVFMTPADSRSGGNLNQVRIFSTDKLNQTALQEKWDKVKVVCTQPFNKKSSYGLSFIKFHSKADSSVRSTDPPTPVKKQTTLGGFALKDDKADVISTGSLFAKRNKEPEKPTTPLTGAAAIRAASKLSDDATPSTSTAHSTSESGTKRRHSSEEETRPKTTEVRKPVALRKQSTSVSSVASTASSRRDAPPLKRSKTEPPNKKTKPFDALMKKVVFCLSGYENPERGRIRDKALEIGATYKPNWSRGCTHLICAFTNTPKYQQVAGKGRIVTKKWIDECHKRQQLLPWRKYRLGDAESPGETSESDLEEDEDITPVRRTTPAPAKRKESPAKRKAESPEPGPSAKKPSMQKKSSNVSYGGDTDEYEGSTDDGGDTDDEIHRMNESKNKAERKAAEVDPYDVPTDEEDDEGDKMDADPITNGDSADRALPELPDFFRGKIFLLFGEFDKPMRRTMLRFITAYDGTLVDYMSEKVNYVVTNSAWDDEFDDALSENPDLAFVKPAWVHACDDKQKLIPHQKYVVAPS